MLAYETPREGALNRDNPPLSNVSWLTFPHALRHLENMGLQYPHFTPLAVPIYSAWWTEEVCGGGGGEILETLPRCFSVPRWEIEQNRRSLDYKPGALTVTPRQHRVTSPIRRCNYSLVDIDAVNIYTHTHKYSPNILKCSLKWYLVKKRVVCTQQKSSKVTA